MFLMWVWYGRRRPKSGTVCNDMVTSRKIFTGRLKWYQNNRELIRRDALAVHHRKGDYSKFWQSTNKFNSRPGLPAVVDGVGEPQALANLFKANQLAMIVLASSIISMWSYALLRRLLFLIICV